MNQTYFSGRLMKDPVMRDGQYGPYAFINMKIDDDGKMRGPYIFVEVSGGYVSVLQGMKANDPVFVSGFLKSKENKQTGKWELFAKARLISPIKYNPQTQVQSSYPQTYQQPPVAPRPAVGPAVQPAPTYAPATPIPGQLQRPAPAAPKVQPVPEVNEDYLNEIFGS